MRGLKQGYKPDSVPFSGHSSFIYATYPPGSDEQSSIPGIHGLSARKVYLSIENCFSPGGLLHHLFTFLLWFRRIHRMFESLRHFLWTSGFPEPSSFREVRRSVLSGRSSCDKHMRRITLLCKGTKAFQKEKASQGGLFKSIGKSISAWSTWSFWSPHLHSTEGNRIHQLQK